MLWAKVLKNNVSKWGRVIEKTPIAFLVVNKRTIKNRFIIRPRPEKENTIKYSPKALKN